MANVVARRPTVARIDLAAVAANFQTLQRFVADTAPGRRPPDVMAVVKANAYGHGAARVALALERAGARWFACADVEEGVELRRAGVRARILVFGALGLSDLSGVFDADLTPSVSTPTAARVLESAAAARGVRLKCHLKIDTGMHRLGLRSDNLERTAPPILASPHLEVEAVYTHFATAEDVESPLYELQRAGFARSRRTLAGLGLGSTMCHAANSAALLRDERVWFDLVRVGLLLYGIVPPPLGSTLPLRPALRIESRVVAVKGLRPGDAVGYGARFVADGPRSIATIPAGYADGLDTRLAGRGVVLIQGRRVPIVGAISMDMMTVDVTGLRVDPGDPVVIVGRQQEGVIDVREMAAALGTIPYELLCRIGARIERLPA